MCTFAAGRVLAQRSASTSRLLPMPISPSTSTVLPLPLFGLRSHASSSVVFQRVLSAVKRRLAPDLDLRKLAHLRAQRLLALRPPLGTLRLFQHSL